MQRLKHLNEINDVTIHSVEEDMFRSFGKVLKGYDWTELIAYMEQNTQVPAEGNCYVTSVPDMEKFEVAAQVEQMIYGGMPIQIGYCNGKNSTYNGFEYHKGSEINVAVTDFMLVLGHSYDIVNNSYDVSQATVFFVPAGTAIEMYQTTLHLSPLKVCDVGFKGIVILPKGTNLPLEKNETYTNPEDLEQKLLLHTNKWVIAHPDREPLIRQGAYPGVTGVNKELYF